MRRPAAAAAVLLAAGAAATGPRSQANNTLAYLLERTRSSRPPNVDPDYDCMWRNLGWGYAQKLQPWLDAEHQTMVRDALELKALCGQEPALRAPRPAAGRGTGALRDDAVKVYVEPTHGSDAAAGTSAAPFATIARAVRATRARKPGTQATVVLRGGTYFLSDTIAIHSEDSGLRFASYQGETAVISGGVNVSGLSWTAVAGRKGVYSASLASHAGRLPRGVPALRHRNKRATLARYPNANPELDIFPIGYITDPTDWGPPKYKGAVCQPSQQCGKSENLTVPVTDAWHGMFQNFTVGIGGACDRYDPPRSPWCSGDFYLLRQFPEMHTRSPSGVMHGPHLPHAAYKRPQDGLVHAWRPGHWYTWMFEVGAEKAPTTVGWTVYDGQNAVFGKVPGPNQNTSDVKFVGVHDSSDSCWAACNATGSCKAWTWHSASYPDEPWRKHCYAIVVDMWSPTAEGDVVSGRGPHKTGGELTFSDGGHQGGEGDEAGGEWFIEGPEEELDAPNEWWFDAAAQTLYFKPNSTDPPSTEVIVPTLSTFFDLQGTMQDPVRGVSFEGVTFVDSRPTFMEPRSNPSGGDWSLERQGAIRMEGVEGTTVTECLFTRLDSNAISINGYARNVTIDKNEFVWLGQSAVASWGRAKDNMGTDGEFPRYNTLTRNFVHEIGHIQKQSSFYFQAETAEAVIKDNICFNIPRAAVNFNDGFGGGSEMSDNLFFNTCRESGDHGAFNSWDRLPYLTTVRSSTPSTIPKRNDMHHNFIVANYAANGGCLDNDDGSAYYDIHDNLCMFGGHKQNFDGHSKAGFRNIYVYPHVYRPTCLNEQGQGEGIGTSGPYGLPPAGYAEEYHDNICILQAPDDFYVYSVGNASDPSDYRKGVVLGNNTVYIPGGDSGDNIAVHGRHLTLEAFQKKGLDPGSKIIDGKPPVDQVSKWVKTMLGF
eukprot:TRINITY_DN19300_c0_g1_i1.p1 TRINITY_DN19300_c0_g1~~TRINITY_DN19300_c0_g1_i1.p1  ORF type:complete len:935 (+),score=273.61 TRINITY_DN19300_c0_g1_i1:66-2870(+)